MISMDQDAIDAEKNADVVVGPLNVSSAPEVISTSASALGMEAAPDYLLNNLWAHSQTHTKETITAEVPSHGVALFRLSPFRAR